LFFSNPALACIPVTTLQVKNKSCFIQFYLKNETELNNILKDKKEICGLNEEDLMIIKDYVLNGYQVKEQTEEEYASFLKEASQANNLRPKDCLVYSAVSHKGRWTGYMETGNAYSTKTKMCAASECLGGSGNIIWNDLQLKNEFWSINNIAYVLIITAIIIVIGLILLKHRKK